MYLSKINSLSFTDIAVILVFFTNELLINELLVLETRFNVNSDILFLNVAW